MWKSFYAYCILNSMEEYIYPQDHEPRLQDPPTEVEKLEALFANIDELYRFDDLNQASKLEAVGASLVTLEYKIKELGKSGTDVTELITKLEEYKARLEGELGANQVG